nr:MAG TPA: head to tail adaptor [Caudoviricetes sp.]
MFLNNLDYQVMIGERAFDLIQQSDEENRRRAEEMAREEMAGYLRPRYDVERIFARRGEQRNMQIVMFLCDITLYHLTSWLPQKMGYDIREIRYRRAIEWLQGVQSGKIVPDLDTPDDSNGEPQPYNLTWGSEQHSNYIW